MNNNNLKSKSNGILDKNNNVRNKSIIITSIVGIIMNVFLAVFKAIVGLLSGSIAIVLDAVNNTSDVASSVITIIGTKLSSKKPDKEHPFGHGRGEYLSALVISVIILYAGFSSFIESVKRIIYPTVAKYSIFTIIVVVVAIIVKIFLGYYVRNKGKYLNSSSLVNSGNDALLDSIISFSTLVAAIVFMAFHLSIEAYLGVLISIIILKSGIDMIKDAVSSILGERVDVSLVKKVKKTINAFPQVMGVYDLIFNNYGPNSYTGSVHIEIPNTYTIDEVDELLREITLKVYLEHGLVLSAIGIYSVDKKNPLAIAARRNIRKILKNYPHILQMHGFYFNAEKKLIQFDMVISFDEDNQLKLYNNVYEEIYSLYPDYKIVISIDNDFSVSI